MTKTDEIRGLLEKRGIKWDGRKVTAGKGAYRRSYQKTTWRVGKVLYCYEEYPDGRTSLRGETLQVNLAPRQALAASNLSDSQSTCGAKACARNGEPTSRCCARCYHYGYFLGTEAGTLTCELSGKPKKRPRNYTNCRSFGYIDAISGVKVVKR